MNSFYDDKKFSYLEYWTTRDYEHQSELVALEKLMGRAKFNTVVDFGGGYGRLSKWLASRVTRVMLIEPADKQRRLAKQFLKGVTNVEILEGNDTKTGLQSGCADLVVAVRVVHHLGDTRGLFTELHRLAKPDGKVIVEFANSLNFKSRLRSILLNVPISKSPIDMRSAQNRNDTTIAFLNHHPATILKTLRESGFEVERVLSVSNFRFGLIKKVIPTKLLVWAEKMVDGILGPMFFGPSIFVLASKA